MSEIHTYKIDLVKLSNEHTNEVTIDVDTTSVNIIPVGTSLYAVLSERVFTPEQLADMEKQRRAQQMLFDSLSAAEGNGGQATLPGFLFEDGGDDDDD